MSYRCICLIIVLAACAPPAQLSHGARRDAVEEFIADPFWDKDNLTPVVRLIRQGAIEEAADSLVSTYQPSADPSHNRLVRELLIGLERWEDLRRLVGPNPSAGEILAALARIPPEQYAFHKSRSTARLSSSTANTPLVEVEINGAKHYFWLDTGTGISVLGTDLAKELGIIPATTSRASVRTVTGRLIEAAPAMIPSIRVGGVEARNHHVLIIETKELQVESLWGLIKLFRIEGILGWNFIQHVDLEFDMRAKQLTLRKPGKLHRNGRNLFWLGWPYVVAFGPNDTQAVLGLDTGSSISFVTPELIAAAKLPIVDYRETTIEGVGGVSSQIVGIVGELPLDIGSESLSFDSMSVHEFTIQTLLQPQGVLGADIMKWGTVRLDWASGKLTLKPYSKPNIMLQKMPTHVY